MTHRRPRRIQAPPALRAHLRRVLPRAMPVPPSRPHRPAKGLGSYRRRPKHPRPPRAEEAPGALHRASARTAMVRAVGHGPFVR